MQNAERRMQNDLISLTLHSQGNELNAERGVRNAERPRYTTFRSQGKVHITNYLDFGIWSPKPLFFSLLYLAPLLVYL